jgi:hypothetical protein
MFAAPRRPAELEKAESTEYKSAAISAMTAETESNSIRLKPA